MNVAFHALGSFATAALLAGQTKVKYPIKLCIGFVAGILIHGILDFLPHQYPLASKIDVLIALLLFFLALVFSRKQVVLLILVCFAGCILPDVIDLGPAIIEKHLGLSVPLLRFKIFPWHQKEYSGSIYDGSKWLESIFYHSAFVVLCAAILYLNRKSFFKV